MKQVNDVFTIDAFSSPPRGRPPVLQPQTNAQRQAKFRKAAKQRSSGATEMKLTDKGLADLIAQLQFDHAQVGKEFVSHEGYSDRLASEICHLGQAIESLKALQSLRATGKE
jgi:hypothetical protein